MHRTVTSLLLGLLAVLAPVSARAADASFSFKPSAATVGVGDEFSVAVVLDSGGATLNTIAGDLVYGESTLKLVRVMTANSIVTSWIQPPLLSGNSVTFAGIMPGGFQSMVDPSTGRSTSAVILTLVFRATAAGPTSLAFSDSHAYLHDGLGTETPLSAWPYSFTVGTEGGGLRAGLSDTDLPEHFTPVVSSSPDLYDGAYAVFFGTTDKGSGIDHYEVSEGRSEWIRAESPYRLADQSLSDAIRVKAVDLAGNYRIEVIPSSGAVPKALWIVPLMLIAALFVALYVMYRRMMRKIANI